MNFFQDYDACSTVFNYYICKSAHFFSYKYDVSYLAPGCYCAFLLAAVDDT